MVRDALGPIVVGSLAGLLGAVWLCRLVASYLLQITSRDPATFLATAAFVLIASALALIVPVWRACHMDAGQALRHEPGAEFAPLAVHRQDRHLVVAADDQVSALARFKRAAPLLQPAFELPAPAGC